MKQVVVPMENESIKSFWERAAQIVDPDAVQEAIESLALFEGRCDKESIFAAEFNLKHLKMNLIKKMTNGGEQ